MAANLMRIEAAKQKTLSLPLTPTVLLSLRETARLITTHYSTMIEGNVLTLAEVEEVLKHEGHFPGRTRDENEIKGYYAALSQVEKWAAKTQLIQPESIQMIHALVMAHGKQKVKPSPYRDGQNVIRDAASRQIIYMPPEAKDVEELMRDLVLWINEQTKASLPYALIAAIAHYQFATIHPYYDGNGRTARLLTTLILHLGGYDLKGLYSLEEYYARNLGAYYEAISIGPSHNYYFGRAEADITKWIEYFIQGMAISFENVLKRMAQSHESGLPDNSPLLRELDPQMRKALSLFQVSKTLTAKEIAALFGYKPRTSAKLCQTWVLKGFLEIETPSNKGRTYRLATKYTPLIPA